MEDFDNPKLSFHVGKTTDELKLWLNGNILTVQDNEQKPDQYHLSGHRNGFLVANFNGGFIPVAK